MLPASSEEIGQKKSTHVLQKLWNDPTVHHAPLHVLWQGKQVENLRVNYIFAMSTSARYIGKKSSPILMAKHPILCNFRAAKVLPSAFHPLLRKHCQCERRKKQESGSFWKEERIKPKDPIPLYWNTRFAAIWRVCLPLSNKTHEQRDDRGELQRLLAAWSKYGKSDKQNSRLGKRKQAD